jgi:hypothetical protein
MGLGDILGKVMGAAAGAVKGVSEIVPNAVSTVATHVSNGVASPPALPNIGAVLSGAATTQHPSGSGQTVLEHYVSKYGKAGLAMVTAMVVPHLPLPAGLKTAGSAALVGFALKALHDATVHMEAPYTGAPA